MKQKDTKQIDEKEGIFNLEFLALILFIFLFFSVLFMQGSTTVYKDGIHNVDLGFNMKIWEGESNTKIIDLGSDGNYRSGTELIQLGYNQIDKGYKVGLFFGVVFGGFFVLIICLFISIINKLRRLEGGIK